MSKQKIDKRKKYEAKMTTVSPRYTSEEYLALQKKAADLEMAVTTYVKHASLNKKVVAAQNAPKINKALVGSLGKVGGNINQIARNVNAAKGGINVNEFTSLMNELTEVKTLLAKVQLSLMKG